MSKNSILGCVLALLFFASCSNESFSPVSETVFEKSTTLSELTRFNDTLLSQEPSTRTWPIFTREFWRRVWNTTVADVVGAWEEVISDDTYQQSIGQIFNGEWVQFAIRVTTSAVGASKKAHNDECAIIMSPALIYEEVCVAFALLEEDIIELGEDEPETGLGGLTPRSNPPLFFDDDPIGDIEPEEPEISLILPVAYTDVETIAIDHNVVLDLIENVANLEEEQRDSLLTAFEMHTGITSQQQDAIINRIGLVSYGMDIEDYVDTTDLAGQILVLFGDIYQSYVESFSDVETIVNNYIGIVNSSTELSDGQKTALITAFSVAAYSSKYWETLYAEETL